MRLSNCISMVSSVWLLLPLASVARADPLLGDFGATLNRADAAVDNPANAAFMPHGEFFYAGELLKSDTFSMRYPGIQPTQSTDTGVALPTNQPVLIFKPTPRFGVGGFVVPPLPVTVNLEKAALPVVLLGNQAYFDAKIAAHLNGLASLVAGYRLNNSVAVGAGFDYVSAWFNAKLSPSGQPDQVLAEATGTLSRGDIKLGSRVDLLGGRVSFGWAVAVLSQQQVDVQVKSPLIDSAGGGEKTLGDTTSGLNFQRAFAGGLAGFRATLVPRLTLLAELRYTRVDPDQSTISLVTLKKEKQDVQDTVAFRGGAIVQLSEASNLLFGGRYEPTGIGPGSRGAHPTAGFGSLDAIQVIAGITPLMPYYMVAAGLQIGLFPTTSKHQAGAAAGWFNQIQLEGGITFTEASLGIDAQGELPGAYYYRKLGAVGGLSYNF